MKNKCDIGSKTSCGSCKYWHKAPDDFCSACAEIECGTDGACEKCKWEKGETKLKCEDGIYWGCNTCKHSDDHSGIDICVKCMENSCAWYTWNLKNCETCGWEVRNE